MWRDPLKLDTKAVTEIGRPKVGRVSGRPDIDEVGYLPVQHGGANLFFQLINARYERGAVTLTSNRGFGEWGEVFGDTVVAAALLDRLLHHAIVIEIAGNSYRLREHAKLVPENLRLPPITAPAKPRKQRGRPPKNKSPE